MLSIAFLSSWHYFPSERSLSQDVANGSIILSFLCHPWGTERDHFFPIEIKVHNISFIHLTNIFEPPTLCHLDINMDKLMVSYLVSLYFKLQYKKKRNGRDRREEGNKEEKKGGGVCKEWRFLNCDWKMNMLMCFRRSCYANRAITWFYQLMHTKILRFKNSCHCKKEKCADRMIDNCSNCGYILYHCIIV